jgi:hypothetical protein
MAWFFTVVDAAFTAGLFDAATFVAALFPVLALATATGAAFVPRVVPPTAFLAADATFVLALLTVATPRSSVSVIGRTGGDYATITPLAKP